MKGFLEQNHFMKPRACTLLLPDVLSRSASFHTINPTLSLHISSRSTLLNIQLIVTPFHFTNFINIHISSLNFHLIEPRYP
jgi:hypothetical protein